MTYRPRESVYAVPWLERLPSLVYLAAALLTVVLVVVGENSARDSALYHYVVIADAGRLIGSRALAVVLSVGAVASVLRSNMRGVRIFGEGVEARELAPVVVPRVRRYRWPQLACIALGERRVVLELWDGRRAELPRVEDMDGLIGTLEKVAAARAIPVLGGRGLDEIPEPLEEIDEKESS
jgi:hypothetical protein